MDIDCWMCIRKKEELFTHTQTYNRLCVIKWNSSTVNKLRYWWWWVFLLLDKVFPKRGLTIREILNKKNTSIINIFHPSMLKMMEVVNLILMILQSWKAFCRHLSYIVFKKAFWWRNIGYGDEIQLSLQWNFAILWRYIIEMLRFIYNSIPLICIQWMWS